MTPERLQAAKYEVGYLVDGYNTTAAGLLSEVISAYEAAESRAQRAEERALNAEAAAEDLREAVRLYQAGDIRAGIEGTRALAGASLLLSSDYPEDDQC